MKCVVYASKAKTVFDDQSIRDLARIAANKNAKHQVTGYLYFSNDHFAQYIEGPTDPVDRLMANIRSDDRHEVVWEIADAELPSRRFAAWHMQWVQSDMLFDLPMAEFMLNHILYMWKVDKSYVVSKDPDWYSTVWKIMDTLSLVQHRLRR